MSFFRSILNLSNSTSNSDNDVPTFSHRSRHSRSDEITFLFTDINGGDTNDQGSVALATTGSKYNETVVSTSARSAEGETDNERAIDAGDNLNEKKASPPARVMEEEEASVVVPVVDRGREKSNMTIFPPFLSSLNRNGRPRFNLEMVREAGRLRIIAVPNHRPEVVRILRGDDWLRIRFINGNNFDNQEETDGEEED